MRRFRSLTLTVFAVLGILVAANAYAYDKGYTEDKETAVSGERHAKMEGKFKKITDQLNLTAEQKKQLEDNKTKNREAMKATFEKMKTYKDQLKVELMKQDLDMKTIGDIQAQIKALQAQMIDSRLNSILEVRKILNREQYEKFISLMDKHDSWRQKGKDGACKSKGKVCPAKDN